MAFGPQYIGANKNIGTDQSVKIRRDDTGEEIYLGGRLVSFKATRNTMIDMDEGITDGGRPYHTRVPNGGSGEMTVERYNGDFDNFMKALDANFYAGQPQIECTITQTIINKFDSSKTINVYTHCVLDEQDTGAWVKGKGVMQPVRFFFTELL